MAFDNAGNTLNTALNINLTANSQTFSDWIGLDDTNDYYGFNLSGRSSLNLALNGLSANANVELLNSNGGLIARSENANNIAESMNGTLDGGRYYIRVYQGANNASTNYNLSVAAQNNSQPDITWRHSTIGQNALWQMNGDSLLNAAYFSQLGDNNWKIEGTADFNRDGKSDQVWRNSATGQNALWYMNGTTVLGTAYFNSLADTNWKIAGTADFNRDGQADIVWRNSATGQNALWYMNNTTLLSAVYFNTLADNNWKIEGTADFNNDGQSDLVWRNSASGQNALWYMNNATLLSSVYFNSLADNNWKIEGTADFNRDGKSDLVWRNSATGENALWYMNNATFLGGVYFNKLADTNWKIASVGSRFNEPNLIDVAGNSTANAFNTGTINGNGILRDRLDATDSNDYYWFNVATSSNFSLSLNGFSADFNVQLLDINGAFIQGSTNTGTTAESISRQLTAGNYYIRVYQSGNATSSYNLNFTSTPSIDPGNTLATAEVQTSAVFSRSEQVSAGDRDDMFRFTVSQSGVFTANLAGLSGDADVRLIQDINGNGAIDTSQPYNQTTGILDTGEILAWQWERGTGSESIRRFLNPGTYYLQVMNYNNQTANYNLTTNFTAAASDNRKFSIQLNFSSELSQYNNTSNALTQAARFWEKAISHSSFNGLHTLVIGVDSGTLTDAVAQGGADSYSTDANNRQMPTSGTITYDTEYVDQIGFNLRLAIHEMGHVLGLVGLDDKFVNYSNLTYNANSYVGWAYGEMLGTFKQTAIPIDGTGHWSFEKIQNEALNTYAGPPDGLVSNLTIAALRDGGWYVNYGVAQPYTLT
ncbi:MAG: FG-GAP-like repeat-containing protein [Aulosira sp. ZfuVER01]|nr:pre-peptidase C-terminal domain-containing protein [Aulosira sp. ZfuVER01]MDZ8001950.1 pre-peptidase C-terminal domain-containing protein [Aulosira sp. DedVER01a]MDZ8055270.1 pre-peptidase C-terminal domain-containing protein [Aulosira sp. ZfuCHP01]